MTLSVDERRALGIIAALLVLAAGARWLERPQPILEDIAPLDIARLEEESRAALPAPRAPTTRPAAASQRPGGPSSGAGTAAGSGAAGRLDPNTATAAELDALPGVGPSLAARIIAERERRPFTSVADLERVRGIGAALATTLAERVTLPAASPAADRGGNAVQAAVENASKRAPETVPGARPDINEISTVDLQKVPGVGPVLAARIVARRDSLRGFGRWEQVDSVAGVGPAMLARLQERLVIRQR